MDAITSIIPALLGLLVGAALQYISGRAAESRRQLLQQRTQAYVDFFKAMAEIAQIGRNKDNLGAMADAKARICIYGSPAVVKSLNALVKVGASVNSTQGRDAVVRLIQAMRKDAGISRSDVEQDDLLLIMFDPEKKS